jgi:putative transposase
VPIPSAPTIVLTERQREILESIARRPTSTQQQVLRARIVLQAARGKTNLQIAADLGIDRDTVSKWRSRWASAREALAAVEEQTEQRKPLSEQIEQILRDAYRPGSPGKFTPEQVCQIISVACEDPQESGRPVSDWTPRELVEEVIQREIVPSISPRQVGRFLKSGRLETAPDPVLALS